MYKTIKTIKSKPRNPIVAFILSFFFTGLGQVYNGMFLKGIVFLILRTIPLLIIPMYIQINRLDSYIFVFCFSLIFACIIAIVSPFESLSYSMKHKTGNLKRFNSIIFYIVFAFINISFIFFSSLNIKYSFNIESISNPNLSPLFDLEDYVLIKKFSPDGYIKGELIIFSDNNKTKISRIIGKEGEKIVFEKNRFYVNSIQVQQGIYNKSEISVLSVDGNNIISETSNRLKYPIRIKMNRETDKSKTIKIILKNDELLVATDNRENKGFYQVIKSESIIGRIEGILFSKKIRKLLLLPYIN